MNTENKSKNTIGKSEYATKYVFRERGITIFLGFIRLAEESKKIRLNPDIQR